MNKVSRTYMGDNLHKPMSKLHDSVPLQFLLQSTEDLNNESGKENTRDS